MVPKISNEEIIASNVTHHGWKVKKVAAAVMKFAITLQKVSQADYGSDYTISFFVAIMLRNLDALTTEDTVMSVLNTTIPDLVKKISAVSIGRDPLTSTSRGICYLGTESTVDALAIHGALSNLLTPLSIDGKTGICVVF